MLNAAQQQGLDALRQGAAPSANQQAALHSLWEKAPGYVPAHRGGWDEFPSAPAADAADGFRSGPSALGAAQDAGEAAQRQAFLKWTQGEAMTAQEKAFVEDLWNTDPHRASEYWAAGEFLDTGAPTSSALDGGGLDGTIKANPMRSPQNAIPNNPSITGHIFRNSPGHLPNTMDNLKLLEDVANDPVCYYGTDKYGTSWYIKIQPDGAQIWVQSRNHVIFDGGLNEVPLQWNADTGLKKP